MSPFYAQRIQAPVPVHGSLSPSPEEVERLELSGRTVFALDRDDTGGKVHAPTTWYKSDPADVEAYTEMGFFAGPETGDGFMCDRACDCDGLAAILGDIPALELNASENRHVIRKIRFEQESGGIPFEPKSLAAVIVYRLEKAGVRPMHNMDPVLLEELHQLQQLMLKAPGRHLPPLDVDF